MIEKIREASDYLSDVIMTHVHSRVTVMLIKALDEIILLNQYRPVVKVKLTFQPVPLLSSTI